MTRGTTSLMSATKISISLDEQLVRDVDSLVRSRRFASRSQAIEAAVREKIIRFSKRRLAEECDKLNPVEEQSLAEEGLDAETDQWPTY